MVFARDALSSHGKILYYMIFKCTRNKVMSRKLPLHYYLCTELRGHCDLDLKASDIIHANKIISNQVDYFCQMNRKIYILHSLAQVSL